MSEIKKTLFVKGKCIEKKKVKNYPKLRSIQDMIPSSFSEVSKILKDK